MPRVINLERKEFTPDEIEETLAVFKKLGPLIRARKCPGDLWKAWVGSGLVKQLATNIIPFDADGNPFFARRQSLEENPHERWPNRPHVMGATHSPAEWLCDTWQRLWETEMKIPMQWKWIHELPYRELKDPGVDIYEHHTFVCQLPEGIKPANPLAVQYIGVPIPWDDFVPSNAVLAREAIEVCESIRNGYFIPQLTTQHLFPQPA